MNYHQIIAGLLIFTRYPGDHSVDAQNGVISAGPGPDEITDPDDVIQLTANGWFPNSDDDGYEYYT